MAGVFAYPATAFRSRDAGSSRHREDRVTPPVAGSFLRDCPGAIVAGVLVSVLLTLWTLHLDGIINNDGVYYILTAEYIAAGDWASALTVFKWPAYSYLIHLVQLIPGVGYEAAAHVVTTVGFTLAVLGFVAVAHALGGRGRLLWLALVVALAYPGFNEHRSYLIRDPMFLGAYLFALAALVRYLGCRRVVFLVAAFAWLLAAALFRAEALLIALVLPLFFMARGMAGSQRAAAIAIYAVLVVPLLALFYGWWLYRPEDGETSWAVIGTPWDLLVRAAGQLFTEFQLRGEDAATVNGGMANGAAAAWMVLRETVEALTVPFTGILLFELVRRRLGASFNADARALLLWLVVAHVAMLFLFALAKSFLAPRYPVTLAITLALAVPFALDRYLDSIRRMARPVARHAAGTLLVFLLVVNFVEGLDNVTDKEYLRDGASWWKDNAGGEFRLASNDLKFVYYAGHYDEKWVALRDPEAFREFLVSGRWMWKDWVAVNVRRQDTELPALLEATLRQEPVRRFDSPMGDSLLIYYTGDD